MIPRRLISWLIAFALLLQPFAAGALAASACCTAAAGPGAAAAPDSHDPLADANLTADATVDRGCCADRQPDTLPGDPAPCDTAEAAPADPDQHEPCTPGVPCSCPRACCAGPSVFPATTPAPAAVVSAQTLEAAVVETPAAAPTRSLLALERPPRFSTAA